MNTARAIDGIDIAHERIKLAEQEAKKAGLANKIFYYTQNVETAAFPHTKYDAIYFNSSLHHMSDLNGILSKCSGALADDGYLFINEYIGPNRFNFSQLEKQIARSTFELIPAKYRISHAEHDRGKVRNQVWFPDPAEVARVDPSEAIHSEEIVDALRQHFNILELNHTGGTLLQFMLDGIAANFKTEDPDSLKVLEMLFKIEDTMIECGVIKPHFAFIAATR